MIVYISIGNSDDKLSQAEWSDLWHEVQWCLAGRRVNFHGRWISLSNDKFQNACWCIEFEMGPAGRVDFKQQLADIARKYRQDSIAWAVVKETEFL